MKAKRRQSGANSSPKDSREDREKSRTPPQLAIADITERQQAGEALRESEAQFSSIFDQTTGGIAQTDLAGRFVLVNDRYCEIVGRSREELLTLRMQDITHPEDLLENAERFRAMVEGNGGSFVIEKRYVRPDGLEVWVHNDVSPIRDVAGRPRHIVALVGDITERKQAEFNLAFLVSVSEDLERVTSLDELMRAVGAKMGAHLNLSLCAFIEINETSDEAVVSHDWHREDVPGVVGKYRLADFLSDDFQTASRAGETFVVRDTAADSRANAERYAALKVGSFLSVPLVRDGQWRFALVVCHSTAHDWRADEIELMREVATRLWNRLERARADEALREQARLTALRADVNAALVSGESSLHLVLQQCCEALVKHLDVAFARIWTLNGAENILELQASAGIYTHLDGPHGRVKMGEFKIGHIAQSAQPLLTNDVSRDLNISDPKWARREGMVAFAGYPMLLEGGVLGVMAMFARHALSEGALHELAPIADGVAQWIKRKRAEEALRESEDRFRAIADNIPQLAWMAEPGSKGQATWFNKAWLDYTGTTMEQNQGSGWQSVHHPDYAEAVIRKFEHHVQESLDWEDTFPLRGKDGRYRWFLSRMNVIRDESGTVTRIFGTNTDVTDLRDAEEGLRTSEERYRDLFNSMDEGYCVIEVIFDRRQRPVDYRFVEVNGAFERQSGMHDVVGRRMLEFVPNIEGHWLANYGHVALTGEPMRFANEYKGLNRWFDVYAFRVGEPDIQRVAVLFTDITERKRAEEEFGRLLASEQQARADADQANRSKDEFLATVSHELRTPLNAILGWTHMLMRGNLDEETAGRGLETIVRNAKAQNQLISDLLDVSRIISGQFRFESGVVDLIQVIEAATDTVRLAADAKGVVLRLKMDPAAGMVSGDGVRLQQVVWNLLTNAVKFTSRGGHVEVRLKRQDTSAAIIVNDNGEGINPEFLPYIFDRFRQAESTTRRQHGGLGLGLAIARHLVEAHGGTIRAASQGLGKGSTFTVILPVIALSRVDESDADCAGADRVGEDDASSTILKGLRVLVIDDEPDARELLTLALMHSGAEVRTAATVRAALEILDQWKPDVLVSDIGMPGEDGYDLIRAIRALESAKGGAIPAVALTGYASSEDVKRAREAGFQTHMAKPVAPSELVVTVASLAGNDGQVGKSDQ